MKGRKGRECGVRNGREQLMYTSSLERLWLSFDTKLKWETKQHTPNNSNLEHSISFCHLHFIIIDCWEKLKLIKKTLQPIDF